MRCWSQHCRNRADTKNLQAARARVPASIVLSSSKHHEHQLQCGPSHMRSCLYDPRQAQFMSACVGNINLLIRAVVMHVMSWTCLLPRGRTGPDQDKSCFVLGRHEAASQVRQLQIRKGVYPIAAQAGVLASVGIRSATNILAFLDSVLLKPSSRWNPYRVCTPQSLAWKYICAAALCTRRRFMATSLSVRDLESAYFLFLFYRRCPGYVLTMGRH